MGNFDQPATVDATVTPVARAFVRALSADNSRPMLAMARVLVPETAEVLAQHLTAGEPALRRTVTPARGHQWQGGCGCQCRDRFTAAQ